MAIKNGATKKNTNKPTTRTKKATALPFSAETLYEVTGMFRYFTRDSLVECYEKGEEWGYNRQVNAKVKRLSKGAKFPVVTSIPHYHAGGVEVESHARCIVLVGDHHLAVDVPMAFFDKIPACV